MLEIVQKLIEEIEKVLNRPKMFGSPAEAEMVLWGMITALIIVLDEDCKTRELWAQAMQEEYGERYKGSVGSFSNGGGTLSYFLAPNGNQIKAQYDAVTKLGRKTLHQLIYKGA